MRGLFILLAATVVVVAANHFLGAPAGFGEFGRRTAWITTTTVIAALLAYVGYVYKGRLDGVFIDDRNRISLSRFQMVVWTVLLVPALMTSAFINVGLGQTAPLEIVVPPEIWALLGIGSFSFVMAPVLVESRKRDPQPGQDVVERMTARIESEDALQKPIDVNTNVPAKEEPAEARWMDIIRGDTTSGYAYVDVSKVQQLAFTILLIVIYAAALSSKLGTGEPINRFPDVDQGFVALLGLSHAAYLAYKKAAP